MRKKSFRLWVALCLYLLLAMFLGGCADRDLAQQQVEEAGVTQEASNQSTGHPGAMGAEDAMTPDIQPVVSDAMIEQRLVTLYYRMQGEGMLAGETRTLFFPKDKQNERVLIEALIDGPSPNLLDLAGLFPQGSKVYKTWRGESLLTVVLTRDFLQPPSGAPINWESDPVWREEIFLRRRMALASIVNTVTEQTAFTAIQFLIQENDTDETGRRIRLNELYEEATSEQILAPMAHSEHHILTHYNTATTLLTYWKEQTFDKMYRFVSQTSARPTDATFQREMQSMNRPLISFSISPGTVSENGSRAVVEVAYEYMTGQETVQVQSFPLQLVREDGLWKIAYDELRRLMEAI